MAAFFSKEILLKCVAWKASNYCENSLGAPLSFEAIAWERGKIVFKKGSLLKPGEVEVFFEEASLIPFFDWKRHQVGGELHLEGLHILKWERKERLPSLPKSFCKWLTLCLRLKIGFKEMPEVVFNRLPKKIQQGFTTAFPDDFFSLDVALNFAKEGMDLAGTLTVEDKRSATPYQLFFGSSQQKGQWFRGEKFPLEKFLAPFILNGAPLSLTGSAYFEGTFDEQFLTIFYRGSDFCADSPQFRLDASNVNQSNASGVHYFDLKTWEHTGRLPLKGTTYQQKNLGFSLDRADTVVLFKNNRIHFQDIVANGEGLDFLGDVQITINSLEDVDLKISADKLYGKVVDAQHFLAHFKPSFLWNIPMEGEVFGEEGALFFHYHFAPAATLVEGRVHGEVSLRGTYPFCTVKDYTASIEYDCKKNRVHLTHGEGTFLIGQRDEPLSLSIPSMILSDFPHCLIDFSCVLKEGKDFLYSLQGNTQKVNGKREITLSGESLGPYESLTLKAEQQGSLVNILEFNWGKLKGKGDVEFRAEGGYSVSGNFEGFEGLLITPLLQASWRQTVERLGIVGKCAFKGELTPELTFNGRITGEECQVGGVSISAFSTHFTLAPERIEISDFTLSDWAGKVSIHKMGLNRIDGQVDLDRLHLTDVHLSRLKSPWMAQKPRGKPFFRTLFIPAFTLENVSGNLSDLTSFSGAGQVEFTNLPKKTLLSNLLFLPKEITARIGLDLTTLVPVRGTINYALQEGKINITSFKDMYSDGKRSRFYLAEGFPAYIDFQGNLNMKVKTKQYSLLMKLAEFFTVTVKGTLLHPAYTFGYFTDPDD